MNDDSISESPVQTIRERVRQATREAVLRSAETVFAERGYHGARMEEIAARAGVSVGTLYNYFGDRACLVGALLEGYGSDLCQQLDRCLVEGEVPFRQRVEQFLRAAVGHLHEHWDLFAILIEEEIAHGRAPAPPSVTRPAPMLRDAYHAAERLFDLGIAQGAVRPENPGLYAALLVGILRAVFVRRLYGADDGSLDTQVEALARFVLEGAGVRPS